MLAAAVELSGHDSHVYESGMESSVDSRRETRRRRSGKRSAPTPSVYLNRDGGARQQPTIHRQAGSSGRTSLSARSPSVSTPLPLRRPPHRRPSTHQSSSVFSFKRAYPPHEHQASLASARASAAPTCSLSFCFFLFPIPIGRQAIIRSCIPPPTRTHAARALS